MPTLSFSQLLSSETLQKWKDTIIEIADGLDLDTQNWSEGGFTRTLVAIFAQLYKTGSDVVRLIAGSAFLDTAEGDWLKFLARQIFQVEPIEATFASAALGIKLTNGGGGLYPIEPGDLTFAHSTTHKTYHNTSGGTLNPGVGQTLTLDIEADEAGSSSSAPVGAITELVTALLGVTCTNEVALVGIDEEKAAALRQRCRNSLAALALGGIKRAYEYMATTAKRLDGSSVGITRVRPMPPPGDGTLDVFIATAAGAVPGADVTIVQTAFDTLVTPYGLNATAVSATPLALAPLSTIWVPATLGLATADVQKLVFDALKTYIELLPIGGTLIPPETGKVYWRALLGVIEGAVPGFLKAQLASEVDTIVADGEVPVYAGALANTTVVQVVI